VLGVSARRLRRSLSRAWLALLVVPSLVGPLRFVRGAETLRSADLPAAYTLPIHDSGMQLMFGVALAWFAVWCLSELTRRRALRVLLFLLVLGWGLLGIALRLWPDSLDPAVASGSATDTTRLCQMLFLATGNWVLCVPAATALARALPRPGE
jgi:hypothetical protein